MSKKGKNIAVTGASGYIGSEVTKGLAERGYSVIAVDMVSPKERGIVFPKNVEFRLHDLRISSEAEQALKGAQIVVHLAADIGPLSYMHDLQADILRNNSAIDVAVYAAMVKNGAEHVVYSSSSMVFQHAVQFPYTEKDLDKTPPPTNVYGFSKLAGEYFARSFGEQYKLPYTIIRYHNVYGPGEKIKGATDGHVHVIPALISKVTSGQNPLVLLGNPDSTRSFIYIDDAAHMTTSIVEQILKGNAVFTNNDFNIGSNDHLTIRELAELVWQLFGDGSEFKYIVSKTKAETAHRREVNVTKLEKALGFGPRTNLVDGLKKTGPVRTSSPAKKKKARTK